MIDACVCRESIDGLQKQVQKLSEEIRRQELATKKTLRVHQQIQRVQQQQQAEATTTTTDMSAVAKLKEYERLFEQLNAELLEMKKATCSAKKTEAESLAIITAFASES